MATVTIPFTFVNNTQNADATQVNSNFSTLASFINTELIQRDASVAFTQIPTLPATTPTLANHATRKGYVDSYFPVTSANIQDGAIMNIDINASAAIAYSKLALASSIVNADIVNATITKSKLATTSGEPAGSWVTFTQATARGSDVNLTSPTLDGAYMQIGKTVHFRAQLSATATSLAACTVGLPSVLGTSIGFVQPANGILTSGGTNRKSVTARIDASVTPRVQFYADADGTAFTGGTAITITLSGTFEVA